MSTHSTLSEMTHYPAGRGYHAVYREHEVNHCPGADGPMADRPGVG